MVGQGEHHDFNLMLKILDVGLRNNLCLSIQQLCNLCSLNNHFKKIENKVLRKLGYALSS